MLNSQILEVAIGLVFVYLLFSLTCSMLQEWLASAILKSRPKTLFKGIASLIPDSEIVNKLYNHPLINALAQISPEDMAVKGLESTLRKQPSDIPARTFALALLDVLAPAQTAPAAQSLPQIRNRVSQIEAPKRLKTALLPLLDAAPQDDLKKAYQNVEKWYDDAMARVTGWYKRRRQLYLVILALVLCPVMNVDTFAIANSLYHDNALRAAVVTAAENRAKQSPPPSEPAKGAERAPAAPAASKEKGTKKATETATPPAGTSPGAPAGTATPAPPTTPGKAPSTRVEKEPLDPNLQKAITDVHNLNLPIGWVKKTYVETKDGKQIEICQRLPLDWNLKPVDQRNWWFKIFGWLFSALAVSMGAPFWFDLLNKLVNLRGAGKPAEKTKEAAKK